MRPTKVIGKTRDGKLVREPDEAKSGHVKIAVGMIDWELLAKQKAALVNMLHHRDDHILWGVIELIDNIQHSSSNEGHPVVWLEVEE